MKPDIRSSASWYVHDAHDAEEVLLIPLPLLVIGLFAPVKQLTAICYRVARIAVQALYCLTPAFFLP
jgi:hypothetical protein